MTVVPPAASDPAAAEPPADDRTPANRLPTDALSSAALAIEFPESLPVSARRHDIEAALAAHQVLVVCGETGSGKTTQLPKIALLLAAARERAAVAGGRASRGRPRLIGHTQPRRIAASSVAKRIADELKTSLGETVGYKVRFNDGISASTRIKLMTDGILLAETQSDPLLRAYDTLIIDEAHERSLNIDFLLGYLKRLLPRRPDLTLIVTSATIDVDRFAQHFAGADGPAPVIQVSGRLFPVEVRWRPFEETREYGLNDAIGDAVTELWGPGSSGGSGGDILVFLPGEREIREAAEQLRRQQPPGVDVLPLFARLSQQEQDRVFEPHGARRIVLATNVAETSLTVPGIGCVIDTGTARVKRYSYRNKVEQLQIERISQAAANQRAGRCGRVQDGICIRLYDEADFASRPPYTEPEILRSSLAGVILRMKGLKLGAVEDFPFLEPPPRRAIADGHQLLAELGAVDERNELTSIGEQLTRLPLDPRVGRMLLEGRDRGALTEVLVLASAMSIQDPRDRPAEQQQAADQAHRAFTDERSEFLADLKLWSWLEAARQPAMAVNADRGALGASPTAPVRRLSHRQQEQRLRDAFISPRRVREWRDVHSQLQTVVQEQAWRLNATPATYEQLHLSLLSGLLGNIGCKSDEGDWYLGARGIRFHRHPGSQLSKRPGRWVVCGELVETTRLYGRGIAAIEPQWLPGIAGHVIKTQLLEPHWEKKAAEVVALERATLYGLVVYANRRVNYGRVDPAGAREIFIRQALVDGEWDTPLPFLAANRKLIRQIEDLEHKSRRQDVLVDDDAIHAWYDQHVPAEVHSGASFERWYRTASRQQPQLLQLTREELMRHDAASVTGAAFPRTLRLGGVDCSVSYLHEPGDAKDGVSVGVPIYALNQVSGAQCEWLVPGLVLDKVLALLRTLPQRVRSRLQPMAEFAASVVAAHVAGSMASAGMVDTLLARARTATQLDVQRADFKPEQLPPHLSMHFRLVGDDGRQLDSGRNLAALQARWGGDARSAFQSLAQLKLASLSPERAGTVAVAPSAAAGAAPSKGRGSTVAAAAGLRDGAKDAAGSLADTAPQPAASGAEPRYTDWTFGTLPELLEIRKGGQTLVGFPALVDRGDHCAIEVHDDPDAAAAQHRVGIRRLILLRMRDSVRAVEKALPEFIRTAALYLPLGSADMLRADVLAVAVDRAFLTADTLPTDADAFNALLAAGRPRLALVANEVARTAAGILGDWSAAVRKLKDARPPKDVADDIGAQLQRLVPPHFLTATPWPQLAHLPRYLKGVALRLDKWRADPQRDAARAAELRPIEQRYLRTLADRRGRADTRLDEFRWLIEELRIGFFAQELRTPQPVSVKRLDKAWQQIDA